MTWYAEVSSVNGQCGGRLIWGFERYSSNDSFSLREIADNYMGKMLIATFNQKQRAAYEACCKEFKWLGQSMPIRNVNSGNDIFTAVFKA